MATLEEVLGRLELSEDTQDLLEQTDFDDTKLVNHLLSHGIHWCAMCGS